jgi:hypothetical protein
MADELDAERAIKMAAAIANGADKFAFIPDANPDELALWDRMATEIARNKAEGFGVAIPNE